MAASDGIWTHEERTKRIHAVQLELLIDINQRHRIAASDFDVIGNLERDGIDDFDSFVPNVIRNERGEMFEAWATSAIFAPSVFNPCTSAPALVTTGVAAPSRLVTAGAAPTGTVRHRAPCS